MDAAAFKQTVCSCIDRMYGVAVAITGSEADAADAVQGRVHEAMGERGSLSAAWPMWRLMPAELRAMRLSIS